MRFLDRHAAGVGLAIVLAIAQTYLLVDALIKANKDFDLLVLPNQNHGYGAASPYMMRRRRDYFVRRLLGVEPPKEYRMAQ